MKTGIIRITIFALGLFAVFSCNQGPIFFTIANEPPPQEALIKGTPTNMVVFKNRLYVASSRLYSYKDGSWQEESLKNVIALAATSEHLYAVQLTERDGVKTALVRSANGTGGWTPISSVGDYSLIQSIYADPDDPDKRVFAGARKDDPASAAYAILYLDGTTLKLLKDDTTFLSGAVYHEDDSTYYLSTRGKGVFQIEKTALGNSAPSELPGSENRMVMGMIKLKYDDTQSPPVSQQAIIAVERDNPAHFYEVKGNEFKQIGDQNLHVNGFATGALALWEHGSTRMLVAGRQAGLYANTTSSYIHGYVEFELVFDGDGFFAGISSRIDPPVVSSNDKSYTSTIGTKPINHLFQAPSNVDSSGRFFASTQNTGLWSYKNRDGEEQWNAEN